MRGPRRVVIRSLHTQACVIVLALLMGVLNTAPAVAQTDQPATTPPDSVAVDSLLRTDVVSSPSPAHRITPENSEVEVGGTASSSGFQMSKSPGWAAVRSAVIPGWGQVYTGSWFWGVVFLGVDAGFVYGAIVQHNRYQDALDASKRTKTDERRVVLELQANFYRDDRNRLIWYTAGVILASSVDAYVRAHLYDFHINPNVGTTPEGDGITAGFTFTFDL